MDFKTKQRVFNENYSLGNINCTFTEKMALISLICYLTEKMKAKKPDVTYYQIVYKLGHDRLPEEVITALAIFCEDFAYGCSDFPTFDLKGKEIPAKIRSIMGKYLPF